MRKLILATALAAGLSSPLEAAPFNPATSCNAGARDVEFCVDYLSAFMAGYEAHKMEAQKKTNPICVPKDESWEAVFPKFQAEYAKAQKGIGFSINEAPEAMRPGITAGLVWIALSNAYPCK